MKTIQYKIGLLLFTVLLGIASISCEKELADPKIIDFSVETATAEFGELFAFDFEYEGHNAVIWTGEPGSDHAAYLEQIQNLTGENERNIARDYDKGTNVTGTVEYLKRYRALGTFTATFIVTNVGDGGASSKQAVKTLEITVVEP